VLAFSASVALAADLAIPPQPSSPAPVLERKAPAGAPNVVLVLLDDVGFGAASTFGGPIATPALEALAHDGLRYNSFHTTAICSPTRASLLTGRNPHVTGIGAVMNTSDDRPGYDGFMQKDTATIAEILRLSGYSTLALGKWHQVPPWEESQAGPFDRWPTGEGFEKFYGFVGGETDHFNPTLYDGTTPVVRPMVKDYDLDEDLAQHGINWIRAQQAVKPGKPFFLYLATGGIHAPIQTPRSWIDAYRGKFDQGWDKLREETFARQKALGVIPADAKLTPRPQGLPAWDSLSPDQKKFASRLMEAYAGYLAHTDAQVGRVAQALKDLGLFDNTLFIYIVGDNGASGEGGLYGSVDYNATVQGLEEPDSVKRANLDDLGGPNVYAHFNAGWAWAMDTPFQWMKTVASHLGGTRNPMVVTWPKRIADKGGLRSQFGHVNDITPTILDAVGLPIPTEVDGIKQKPMDGTSLVYSFNDANAPERHHTQYFEVFGHRAIYQDGWMASAFHRRLPWTRGFGGDNKPFDQDHWELYDLRKDFSQADDLSAKLPEKAKAMEGLFMQEAAKNRVLPLSDVRAGHPGLPDLAAGVTHASYSQGTEGVPESAIPHIYNRSWSVQAKVDATADAKGVVAAVGGRAGGWSFYLDLEHRPVFTYRLFALKTVELRADQPLPLGANVLRVDFDYDGGGYGKGGKLTFQVNGKVVARDALPASPIAFFTIDETFDVGIDRGSPVGDYPADAMPGYALTGAAVEKVDIDLR
jgi:arylsulfatase